MMHDRPHAAGPDELLCLATGSARAVGDRDRKAPGMPLAPWARRTDSTSAVWAADWAACAARAEAHSPHVATSAGSAGGAGGVGMGPKPEAEEPPW